MHIEESRFFRTFFIVFKFDTLNFQIVGNFGCFSLFLMIQGKAPMFSNEIPVKKSWYGGCNFKNHGLPVCRDHILMTPLGFRGGAENWVENRHMNFLTRTMEEKNVGVLGYTKLRPCRVTWLMCSPFLILKLKGCFVV